ncbi:glycosyltransferase family 2 protein [Candidatus Woesearchaeota archaeon]|nr:glycosyltransferase family 2 protein [Candidatus Woesearchaeota archaeon]
MPLVTLLSNIITTIFLLVVLSYYVLIFIKARKHKAEKKFNSITVLVPAHNEERYIGACIKSIKNAEFNGTKKIIVINDGSTDKTEEEIKNEMDNLVTLINTSHKGKANAINKALKYVKSEIVVIVDADSTIDRYALAELAKTMSSGRFAAATGVVKVKNRKLFFGMWLHIEQTYNSLMRSVFSKINANIVTPGPLSIYRKSDLRDVGGFSDKGFSEDVDIAVRLIRKGHKIGFNEKAVAETNMPSTFKGFFKQRSRFAKGWINIFKKHLQINTSVIDVYSLPLALFTYIQAVIMGIITIYNILSGYFIYFYSKGMYLNIQVIMYFIDWLSIVGAIKWILSIIHGTTPLTFITAISLIIFLLSYPLYLVAIIKLDKKIDIWHFIPLFFMFPFWLLVMIIYIISLPESLKSKQYNIWEKSE